MFFIHGGGYIPAARPPRFYDGAAPARRGCVHVSVNYRLGGLGCLTCPRCPPRNPIDGNLFLRDIVEALRWVNWNIAAFGGDPRT